MRNGNVEVNSEYFNFIDPRFCDSNQKLVMPGHYTSTHQYLQYIKIFIVKCRVTNSLTEVSSKYKYWVHGNAGVISDVIFATIGK